MTDDLAPWYPELGSKEACSLGWLCPATFRRPNLRTSSHPAGGRGAIWEHTNPEPRGDATRVAPILGRKHKGYEDRAGQPLPNPQACSVPA